MTFLHKLPAEEYTFTSTDGWMLLIKLLNIPNRAVSVLAFSKKLRPALNSVIKSMAEYAMPILYI